MVRTPAIPTFGIIGVYRVVIVFITSLFIGILELIEILKIILHKNIVMPVIWNYYATGKGTKIR